MSSTTTSRKSIAQNAATAIAEIVRWAHRETGCRIDVDVRKVEVTTYSDSVPSYEYTVEVTLNEYHTGKA